MIDWTKPIEWSNGEEAWLSGDWQAGSYHEVKACNPWVSDTGEPYVAVSATTGEILGCEQEGYPTIRNRKPPASQQGSA